MSDSAQLVQIINNVLQPNDPNLRKQSEDILNNLRNEKPNELVCAYLEILKGNTPNIQPNHPSSAETSLQVNYVSASPISPPPPTPTCGPNSCPRCNPPLRFLCSR